MTAMKASDCSVFSTKSHFSCFQQQGDDAVRQSVAALGCRLVAATLMYFCAAVDLQAETQTSGTGTIAGDDLESLVRYLQKQDSGLAQAINTLNQRLQALEVKVQSQSGQPAAPSTKAVPAGAGQRLATPAQAPDAPKVAAKQAEAEPQTGERKIVKAPPKRQATQAIVQEAHGVFDRNLTIETGISYQRSDRTQLTLSGFLALDAIFLGAISLDDVASDVWTLDVGARYGLTPRLQLTGNVPWLYREAQYSKSDSGAVGGSADLTIDRNGMGDASFGINYQLVPESKTWPDIVLNASVKAPTGTDPYGIELISKKVPGEGNNTLIVPAELPTGNGVWSVSGGVSVLRTVDPAVLFASLSYTHNLEGEFDDILSAKGDQPGKVRLGDTVQYGVGLALALNSRTSLSTGLTHALTAKTEVKPDGGSWQEIARSDANAATFNVGTTFALTDRLSMIGNVGIGLTNDAPDFKIGFKFPYTF